jgi:hypothetical protein
VNHFIRIYPLFIFFAAAGFFAVPSKAQERDPEKITFGIGIEFFPSAIAGDQSLKFQQPGFANLIAPIQLGPHIFIEPELGVYIYNQDQTVDSVKQHFDREIVRTGFGVFYSVEPDKSFEWYIGARLGIFSSEQHQKPVSADSSSQWGVFYAGDAFGVEYFFSPHFAIGGELQLNHIGFGAPIIDEVPWTAVDSTHSVWSTNASISARFYF